MKKQTKFLTTFSNIKIRPIVSEDKDKYLVHACLEGPEAGVYYRGKDIIQDNEYTEIKTIECCPNANILWRLLKEQLINNLKYYRNKLNIVDMNEDMFLEKIDIIYNTRKIVEINQNIKEKKFNIFYNIIEYVK